MAEIYQFREGHAYLWTGAANASGAAVAWVNDGTLAMRREYQNEPMADGTYRFHFTGQAVTYNLTLGWVDTSRLKTLWDAATGTPVHVKLMHDNVVNGSAGYILYSGRMLGLSVADSQGTVTNQTIDGQGNLWSAF